ncbi:hypothetical protein CGRA01v4_07383 [Colletotrichum graminicola]|nr:hypothetical protein CGRA01v4_07383 [Colletotrichum graminicola]
MRGIPSSASACSPPLYASPSPPCVTFTARRRWRSFYNPSSRREQQEKGGSLPCPSRFLVSLPPCRPWVAPDPEEAIASLPSTPPLPSPPPFLREPVGARGREDWPAGKAAARRTSRRSLTGPNKSGVSAGRRWGKKRHGVRRLPGTLT